MFYYAIILKGFDMTSNKFDCIKTNCINVFNEKKMLEKN